MIAVLSRFQVRNGLQAEVRRAFLERPKLVDDQPGFLGMEVFNAADDATVFYLVTRWTDTDSYRAWHTSEAHKRSHEGIPPGLKLDPEATWLACLERIEPDEGPSLEQRASDRAPLLAGFLTGATTAIYLEASRDLRIRLCSDAFAAAVKLPADEVVGRLLTDFLIDAAALQARLAGGRRPLVPMLLNFDTAAHEPFTLRCLLDVQPDAVIVLGEPAGSPADDLATVLLRLNNELTAANRELARERHRLREMEARLKATLEERDRSYWHLRKIHEYLPICMGCGKVRTTDTTWQDLAEFLRQNSDFLTHSYCPVCKDAWLEQYGLTEPQEGQ